jgi:hypothetical protein
LSGSGPEDRTAALVVALDLVPLADDAGGRVDATSPKTCG